MSFLTGLKCIRCSTEYPIEPRFDGCPKCAVEAPSNLTPTYDYAKVQSATLKDKFAERRFNMWRYREFLPPDMGEVASLGEGGTPLLSCSTMGDLIGVPNLYLKDESRNPTGSFKDRLAVVALAMSGRFGAKTVGVSSTGNAGAAAAAYSAKKGYPCVVLTVSGAASVMMAQIRSYGAMTVAMENKEDRWTLLQDAIQRLGWYPTSPYFGPPIGSNCYGVDGYKTIAYEICEQLDWQVPDFCVFPVAYGDAIYGIWKGFSEWAEMGLINSIPRMVAGETADSLQVALREGVDAIPLRNPPSPSVAGSINVSQSTYQALHAIRESNGLASTAPDDTLLELQSTLAIREGIYAEPSSLAALSVIRNLRNLGEIKESDVVVAVLTATGMKGSTATESRQAEIPVVNGNLEELLDVLDKNYQYSK